MKNANAGIKTGASFKKLVKLIEISYSFSFSLNLSKKEQRYIIIGIKAKDSILNLL